MVLSNCGHFSKSVFVSGKVTLRNSTGLLPELYREEKRAYMVFLVLWGLLCGFGTVQSYRYSGSNTSFFKLVVFWVTLAFVDCLFWNIFYAWYNLEGSPP